MTRTYRNLAGVSARGRCEFVDEIPARRADTGSSTFAACAYQQIAPLETLPARRLLPTDAAAYLGYSVRTLEEWRALWRRAQALDRPELRRGPPFIRIGTRVFYAISDLDAFRATARTKAPVTASSFPNLCNDDQPSLPDSKVTSDRSAVTT